MAISLYNTATINANAVAATDRSGASFSHDSGSGANRLLLVSIKIRDNAADRTVSAVTYNTVALTKITGASLHNNYSGSNWQIVEWWYLVAPATGSNTLAVTYSGTITLADEITAITLNGVHQTSPIGNANTSFSSTSVASLSYNITTTAVDSWLVAAFWKNYQSTTGWTPSGAAVELTDTNTGTGSLAGDITFTDIYLVATTTTAYTLSSTANGSAAAMVSGGVEIKAAPSDIAITMDALTLASSTPDLDVVPGDIAKTMDVLTLTSSAADLIVAPGERIITVEALQAVLSVLDVITGGDITIAVNTLTAAMEAVTSQIIPGSITKDMDVLTLASSVPNLIVVPGEVAKVMDVLTLLSSVPNLIVSPGPVTITLDTLQAIAQAVTIADQGPQAGPRWSLRAWWPLDVDGADLHNDYDLTEVNTISYVAGKVSDGAELESANVEYLTRGTNELSMLGQSFTCCCWFKPASVAAGQRYNIASGSLASNQFEWGIRRNADRVEFLHTTNGQSGTVSTLQNTVAMSAGTWYFICAKYDADTDIKSLTVNTTTVTASSITSMYGGGQRFDVGFLHNLTSNSANAVIDNVVLYERALSTDEISWHYNSGNGRNYAESAPTLVILQTLLLPLDAEPTVTVPGEVTKSMNTLEATTSVPNMAVLPGEVIKNMDTIIAALSTPNLIVVPGEVALLMQTLTLLASTPNLAVLPGEVAIQLATLIANASPVTLSILLTIISRGVASVSDRSAYGTTIRDTADAG